MKNLMNNRWIACIVVVIFVFAVQSCKTTQSTAATPEPESEPLISYAADIRPMMITSCTPCHFPENGRKKMLDTHAATKETINDIVRRVELGEDEAGYMPFRSKRPALTAEQVSTLKKWAKQGFPE